MGIESREAERWADAYPAELGVLGKDNEQVIEGCREGGPEMRWSAYLFMDNFLGIAHEESTQRLVLFPQFRLRGLLRLDNEGNPSIRGGGVCHMPPKGFIASKRFRLDP